MAKPCCPECSVFWGQKPGKALVQVCSEHSSTSSSTSVRRKGDINKGGPRERHLYWAQWCGCRNLCFWKRPEGSGDGGAPTRSLRSPSGPYFPASTHQALFLHQADQEPTSSATAAKGSTSLTRSTAALCLGLPSMTVPGS